MPQIVSRLLRTLFLINLDGWNSSFLEFFFARTTRDLRNPKTAKKPQTRSGVFSVKVHGRSGVFLGFSPKTLKIRGFFGVFSGFFWGFFRGFFGVFSGVPKIC